MLKATNIKWDTDGDMKILQDLPSEVEIPEGLYDAEEISDFLSSEYGFCHFGIELHQTKKNEKKEKQNEKQ